jgi:hypothetical protein
VPGFVVRRATSLRFRDHDIPGSSELNLFESVRQVPLLDRILFATGGKQRRFIY